MAIAGPNTTVAEYDVTGTTVAEIQASLAAERPGYDAWTELRASLAANDDGTHEVRFGVVVVLPRLVSAAPEDVVKIFAEYRRRLEAHEARHAEIYARAFPELRALRPGTTDQIVAQLEEIRVRYEAESNAYDLATDHGRTEGVSFPPL